MIRRTRRVLLAVGLAAGLASCGADEDCPDCGGLVNPTKRRVTVSGTGSGRITSTPNGINCVLSNGVRGGEACEFDFATNTQVTLQATPDADQLFRAWGDGCSGTTCQLTLTQAVTVSAAFVPRVATRTLRFTTSAADDGAAIISVIGAPITGVVGTSGVQATYRTRNSDGKTFVLVRGPLTSGIVATLSISGLDGDKTLTPTVEQVSARQSGNYAQRTLPGSYSAAIP